MKSIIAEMRVIMNVGNRWKTSRQNMLFSKYENIRYLGLIGYVLRAEKYPYRKTKYIFELS